MEKHLDRNGFNYEGTYRPGNSYSFIPCVRCYAWVSWCCLFIRGLIMTTSWVIVETATNKAICETYSMGTVAAINKAKYKAVPILEYLQAFNRSVKND